MMTILSLSTKKVLAKQFTRYGHKMAIYESNIFSFVLQNWKKNRKEIFCFLSCSFWSNGVLASGWDKVLLSYMIYSALFMPPFREGRAVLRFG